MFGDIQLLQQPAIYKYQGFAAHKVAAKSKGNLIAKINEQGEGLFQGE